MPRQKLKLVTIRIGPVIASTPPKVVTMAAVNHRLRALALRTRTMPTGGDGSLRVSLRTDLWCRSKRLPSLSRTAAKETFCGSGTELHWAP